MEAPQKTKSRAIIWTTIPLLGILPKEGKSGLLAHPCLLQTYSWELKYRNSPNALKLKNGLRKCGIYIQYHFIYHKGWKFVICR
jgi:hypothetical protein